MASTSTTTSISLPATTPPPAISSCHETPEVVPVHARGRLEPDAAHLAAVDVAVPERRAPLAEPGHVERYLPRGAPDRQVGLGLEVGRAGSLGVAAREV